MYMVMAVLFKTTRNGKLVMLSSQRVISIALVRTSVPSKGILYVTLNVGQPLRA